MVPVLFDFTWADARRVVNGVSLGGRSPVLRDAVARHALWRVVDTLVAPFGRHPGIAMWDLWNEPDWMIAPWRPPSRRLSPRRLRQCLSELALHVRWHATQPLTVGLASARGLPLCRDLSLDVLQVHWYDHLERRAPLSPRARVSWSDAPLVLGEFPTRGSARAADAIAALARDAGYAAAWPWSLHADDRSTDRAATLQALAAMRDDRAHVSTCARRSRVSHRSRNAGRASTHAAAPCCVLRRALAASSCVRHVSCDATLK